MVNLSARKCGVVIAVIKKQVEKSFLQYEGDGPKHQNGRNKRLSLHRKDTQSYMTPSVCSMVNIPDKDIGMVPYSFVCLCCVMTPCFLLFGTSGHPCTHPHFEEIIFPFVFIPIVNVYFTQSTFVQQKSFQCVEGICVGKSVNLEDLITLCQLPDSSSSTKQFYKTLRPHLLEMQKYVMLPLLTLNGNKSLDEAFSDCSEIDSAMVCYSIIIPLAIISVFFYARQLPNSYVL